MWREARARGGNTAVAMRVEGNEIGGMMSELATFGTAVTGEPVQLPRGGEAADAVSRWVNAAGKISLAGFTYAVGATRL
jgi:hypothetical protein